MLSMADLPSHKVKRACRCAVCDCYAPAGWWVAPLPDSRVACTATCAGAAMEAMDVDALVDGEDEARDRLHRVNTRCERLRSEIEDLEQQQAERETELEQAESHARRLQEALRKMAMARAGERR